MISARHPDASPRRFAVRRLQDLAPPRRGRDWDVRFVSATLLFYGLMGIAFFLVDWLNTSDTGAPTEIAAPYDEQDRARTPYMMRRPQLLKDRDADMPQETR